jgi:hypothetical protein
MINAEGAKGHQYADEFEYTAIDITRPYRPERYTEALRYTLASNPKPAVVIIDSCSHMHDGPGGLIEYQSDELDRLAGDDQRKRDRMNPTAWIKPKAAENQFIYAMLEADCHLILCFRAKEKMKWIKGGAPIDLGLQPIAGERVAFETIFTLMLPPHSKGVPDLAISEMRKPFDTLIPSGQQLSEDTGATLAGWAAGAKTSAGEPQAEHTTGSPTFPAAVSAAADGEQPSPTDESIATTAQQTLILTKASRAGLDDDARHKLIEQITGQPSTKAIPKALVNDVLAAIDSAAA